MLEYHLWQSRQLLRMLTTTSITADEIRGLLGQSTKEIGCAT